jgi:hydroxymethylpyrimidine pyrophosphatase-like HAD family hydrolase
MNDTSNRLYISDLDGTLLRSDAMLSGYAKRKLNALLLEGLRFTVASARNVHSVRALLAGLNMNLPVIGSNGAYISEFKTGSPLMINSIDNDVAKEIFSLIGRHSSVPLLQATTAKKTVSTLTKSQTKECSGISMSELQPETSACAGLPMSKANWMSGLSAWM